jgi:hypothetical protein
MKIDISQKVTVDAKIGINEFYSKLVFQMYYAMNKAAEAYLEIAKSFIVPRTGQLYDSGQVQDVDVKWSTGDWQTVARFEVQASFGREEDSFRSVVWRQTEDQQKILDRQPFEQDNRAIANEVGFYAWEVRKKKNWVRRPYLYQGLDYIKPAFIDFMKDWNQLGGVQRFVEQAQGEYQANILADINYTPSEAYYGAWENN